MKAKEMILVIDSRINSIQEQFRLMLVDFNEEAIHHFRTDIKKLRAFFRLLNTGLPAGKKLNLHKKIKIFYWYAGNIRNIQLHQKVVTDALDPGNNKPSRYFDALKKKVESLQGAVKTLSTGIFTFGKINLPSKIGKRAIKKFIGQEIKELTRLLTELPTDDIIHKIRKLLKDILYNWKYCKPYKSMLPDYIAGKKTILSITELIGTFCDKSAGINLLQLYVVSASEEEIEWASKIIKKWNQEKDDLQVQVYSALAYKPA